MNVNAAAWTPGGFSAPVPAPAAAIPAVTTPPPAPVEEATKSDPADDDEEEEEIDENDPLWQAVMKVTEGDRARALRMLGDPDSLMAYPEVVAIMEAGDAADDDAAAADSAAAAEDWEKGAADDDADATATDTEDVPAAVAAAPAEAEKSSTSSKESPSKKKAAAAADEEEEEVAADNIVLEEGDPRPHLNIVFIGHVDAGKSTLSGSILYLMGMVDKRTIERFEREAKDRNRESWFLAFIMDTSEEERAKGKTVEVGRAHFETESNRYTILDAPGHKNYVPNMIAGATQADVGVLVISARKGEFETGFEKGGQTREHAMLARTLGVRFLVVVINKMDDPTVMWSKERYEECVTKLKPYLKQVGYTIKTDVKFVPISGLSGDNVLNEVDKSKCTWWNEYWSAGTHNTTQPSLISIMDNLVITGRDADAPLRIPVLDRYFERGCVVMGKVENGTVRVGDEVVFAPTKKKAKVEAIEIGEKFVASAKPGENVLLKFSVNVEDIQKGYIICPPATPCPAVREVRVQLALVEMLEHRPLFTPGYDAVMHVHTVEIEVTCIELLSVVDKGKSMKRPFARTGQVCTARLRMPISTCMEPFESNPALGRVTLRDEGRTIAIGKILDLVRPPASKGAAAAAGGK